MKDIVERLKAEAAKAVACEHESFLIEAAVEIERLHAALELIAIDPGGIPGPRVFARDVLAGNIILHPLENP
ncbi:MAG TPA: hypothetical protein VNZ47_11935 [Candidatus Dormibacteraeota bacterium]|jgi:hypothetical protein|nr:hypothetical protein [Candidatus Dormibacteraeota bacterium]